MPSRCRDSRKTGGSTRRVAFILEEAGEGVEDQTHRPVAVTHLSSISLMPRDRVARHRARMAWAWAVAALPWMAGAISGMAPTPTIDARISFSLDDEAPSDGADEPSISNWQKVAQRAASLEQLECSPGLLGATTAMVDAAGDGDSLAM